MKQIIPFKKELLFKTKVSEITSISLEHTLTLKNDDLISGEFHISGDYKMTEGSINRENFQFKLPFDIALDSRYDIETIVIDIDNFYYEIVNNETLQVNIDVYVEGEKVADDNFSEDLVLEKDDNMGVDVRNEFKMLESVTLDDNNNLFEEDYQPAIEVSKPQSVVLETENEIINKVDINLFENIDNSDTYVTYYVYIVKEDDTLDKILDRYGVTKEEVSNYNNLDNITPGTKLIIPSCNNE